MTCIFCGTRNTQGEHRCRRCGRRPDDPLAGELRLHQTAGALAAQPLPRAYGPEIDPESQGRNLARAVQRPLFPERTGNVIPIESYSPPAPKTTPRAAHKTALRRGPRVPDEQGKLDFLAPEPAKPRTLGTTVEAMIYCEERVASIPHRAVAAVLDWSVVLIAYGLFMAVFALFGGSFSGFSRLDLTIFGSVLPLFALIYGLVWSLAGTETPGMRWMRLRLTTFDGFRPERRERLLRFAGSCLSLGTMLGALWSLADEEGLAWQDHISRTFPTPRRLDSQVFHLK